MSGIDHVAQKTAQAGSEIEKLNQKRQAFSQLGAGMAAVGTAAAVGVGLAVSKFAEFDQQMSFVRAATHETAANMDLLRDAALDAGARTVYSATEAAGAIEELAKAGVSTADILSGGLDAALDLAAAGGLDVAQAAGIAATALKTFNLEGEDMSHVADLLAAGAGKAMGDVSQLSQALAQGGQVAKSTGLSIEETTAGLSAFAAQGLLGSDAGTSFKSMLQRLTPQSNEAKNKMAELGISAYDAKGEFIGLAEFAGNLQAALRDLTPEQRNAAMATIFGADAVRAATVLYSEGEDGIRDWISAVDDQGYAAETAAMRLDNLAGDVEKLGGAFDTALIQSGSGANDALRGLVQTGTAAVDMFGALPEPVQQTAVYLGLAAAGVGLVGGALMLAIPRMAEFKATATAAGFSMKGLSLAAGGVTLGLTAVIGIVAAVAQAQAEARAKAEAYAGTLERGTQRITAATREMAKEALAADEVVLGIFNHGSAYDAAERLGISIELVTDAATGSSEALAELQDQIDSGADGSLDYANAATVIENAVRGESASIEEAAEQARQKEKADKSAAAASETHASSADILAEAAQGAASSLDDMKDALGRIGETAITMSEAIDQAQGSLNDMAAAASAEGASLWGLDDASLALRASMRDVEDAHRDAAQAILDNGGTLDEAKAKYQEGRAAVIAMLEAKGLDTAAATAWADANLGSAGDVEQALVGVRDAVNAIPDRKKITFAVDGLSEADAQMRGWVSRWDGKRINIRVDATGGTTYQVQGTNVRYNAAGNLYERGKPKEFAAGGWASGIYPATPGGLLKFAEAGHDEAFITLDPGHRDRSLDIWSEVGNRLGAWQRESPPMFVGAAPGGAESPPLQVNLTGPFYSYDPHTLAREAREQFSRGLDAHQI